MSILVSQYLRPAILCALAIPLLAYDFSSVNWIVVVQPVDVRQPVVVSETFHVPRNGPYVVQFGIVGSVDDCVWRVTGTQCDNSHAPLDAEWKVTEDGRVVLDGRSAAGFRGTWSTAEGGSGVTLGSFSGLSDKQYGLSFAVHSPAPDLMARKPQITVEAGQQQRNIDLLKHAAAFVAAMGLFISSLIVAKKTATKRRVTLAERERV
jgi:hypothetical protein